MLKKIFLGYIALTFSCTIVNAETPVKILNYYYALMEYYALYCDRIGTKELDEASILMFPEKYVLDEKDDLKKQEYLKEVSKKLQKIIPIVEKGTHEYRVLLRTTFSSYDITKEGFSCNIVNDRSCLDLLPLENDMNNAGNEDKGHSIILRGLMFGKVNRIKLFFINTEKYTTLKCPVEKANAFQKSRADILGAVDKEVYAVITIEILPKNKNLSEWDNVRKKIYTEGMESNYLILARIKNIEVYDDDGLKNKIGDVGGEE